MRQGFFLRFRSGHRPRGFCRALNWWETGGVGGLRNRSGSKPNACRAAHSICLWSRKMHISACGLRGLGRCGTAWGGPGTAECRMSVHGGCQVASWKQPTNPLLSARHRTRGFVCASFRCIRLPPGVEAFPKQMPLLPMGSFDTN